MVILVDENDSVLGSAEKIEAHKKGLLHRAISVFIFNSKNELLLQQRADKKYHSPGLWTNTCCSHPFPDEITKDAAHRRLAEEMGMEAKLEYKFKFKYIAPFDNGLTEHEIDHVFIGFSDEKPKINKEEVENYKYMPINKIEKSINNKPHIYTEWFKIILKKFKENIK